MFIALAHGGVAAGMDVFLRYCNGNSADSEFYPVRFSRNKSKDIMPQISPNEIVYLQEKVKGKDVFIFDEDKDSGKTMDGANYFFHTIFPKSTRICSVYNLDVTTELNLPESYGRIINAQLKLS
jgi:hypoxanthine-guanine phosphoribosyltransferase